MVHTLWLASVLSGVGGFALIAASRNVLGEIEGAIFLVVSAVFYSAAVIVHAIERRS